MFIVVKLDVKGNSSTVIHVEDKAETEEDKSMSYMSAYEEMIEDIDKTKPQLKNCSVSYIDKHRTEIYTRSDGFLFSGSKELVYIYQIILYDDEE